jgi:hypothetical protein
VGGRRGRGRDTIVPVHSPFDALVEPTLDHLAEGLEQRLELLALFIGETIEHVVGQVVVVHRPWSDPNAEPGIVLALQRTLDTLEPIVTARAAGATQPEAAQVEGHLVDQDQQIAGGIHVGKCEERP